jgi:hypothetical protein
MPRSAKNASAVRNQAAGELAQNLGSETAAAAPLAEEGCSSVFMLTTFYQKMRKRQVTSCERCEDELKTNLFHIYNWRIYHLTSQRIFTICTTLQYCILYYIVAENPPKRYEMLTLTHRASQQRPPSWGSGQDLFLLRERSLVRAAVPA